MESLLHTVDAYCERTDAGYWSEPVNALTNGAFLIAAAVMWWRLRGQDLPLARAMCVVLGLIGLGSYLFHTHAAVWASIADVLPIVAFILLYLYAANRHYWHLPVSWSLVGTVAFFPFAFVTVPFFRAMPGFSVSAAYWPVAVLIGAYAVALASRAPATARGLAVGASLLSLSLGFRSLDMALCGGFPLGTHFLWHLLNALMLGSMIEVYRRFMVCS